MIDVTEADRDFGEHMRKWREDRGLSLDDMGHLLDVEPDVIEAWEQGIGLPPDTQDLGLRYRALQDAAGEQHHDLPLVDGGHIYGIPKIAVREVWDRYLARKFEPRRSAVQYDPEHFQPEPEDAAIQDMPEPEHESQVYRRGPGGRGNRRNPRGR